jgi:hypothetical protein
MRFPSGSASPGSTSTLWAPDAASDSAQKATRSAAIHADEDPRLSAACRRTSGTAGRMRWVSGQAATAKGRALVLERCHGWGRASSSWHPVVLHGHKREGAPNQ